MNDNTSKRLKGKVAVVTGGASGIGEATVRAFVANGAKVVIVDIQDAAGQELVQELGGDEFVRYIHCDVTSEKQFAAAIDLSISAFGKLDILHNNAGIVGAVGPIDTIDEDDWIRTFDILVKACFFGIKHATRVMRAGNNGGSIINSASVASLLGGLGPHCYTSCKHAVIGLTKSAAGELRSYQIRVNAISPCSVITPLLLKAKNSPIGYKPSTSTEEGATTFNPSTNAPSDLTSFLTTVENVASVALFLASDESKYVSGQNIAIDGSQTAAPYTVAEVPFWGRAGMLTTSVKSEDQP